MGEPKGSSGRVLLEAMRAARDLGLDSCARVVLAVTRSEPYARATSLLARPGLVAAALARRKTSEAMSRLLSSVNLPSRADVLALSVRLTHIETTLDDLGAALEAVRASAATSPQRRPPADRRGPRPPKAS